MIADPASHAGGRDPPCADVHAEAALTTEVASAFGHFTPKLLDLAELGEHGSRKRSSEHVEASDPERLSKRSRGVSWQEMLSVHEGAGEPSPADTAEWQSHLEQALTGRGGQQPAETRGLDAAPQHPPRNASSAPTHRDPHGPDDAHAAEAQDVAHQLASMKHGPAAALACNHDDDYVLDLFLPEPAPTAPTEPALCALCTQYDLPMCGTRFAAPECLRVQELLLRCQDDELPPPPPVPAAATAPPRAPAAPSESALPQDPAPPPMPAAAPAPPELQPHIAPLLQGVEAAGAAAVALAPRDPRPNANTVVLDGPPTGCGGEARDHVGCNNNNADVLDIFNDRDLALLYRRLDHWLLAGLLSQAVDGGFTFRARGVSPLRIELAPYHTDAKVHLGRNVAKNYPEGRTRLPCLVPCADCVDAGAARPLCFHPPARDDRWRLGHLLDQQRDVVRNPLDTSMWLLGGERPEVARRRGVNRQSVMGSRVEALVTEAVRAGKAGLAELDATLGALCADPELPFAAVEAWMAGGVFQKVLGEMKLCKYLAATPV